MKAVALASVFERYPNSVKEILEIAKKRHLNFLLPDVYKVLKNKSERIQNLDEVVIESPFEMSPDARESVEKRVGLKIAKTRINKEMIAGFKVYTKDKILDASLDTLLKQIIK
jgi:F0F1-type ATP synthase delta subunit